MASQRDSNANFSLPPAKRRRPSDPDDWDFVTTSEGETSLERPRTSDPDDLDFLPTAEQGKVERRVVWRGGGVVGRGGTYYGGAVLDGRLVVAVGDTVAVSPAEEGRGAMGTLAMMYSAEGQAMVHLQWLLTAAATGLGEGGDPRQLFPTHTCTSLPLLRVSAVVPVEVRGAPGVEQWRQGGEGGGGGGHWVSLRYGGQGRFHYGALPPRPEGEVEHCGVCAAVAAREEGRAVVGRGEGGKLGVRWGGEELQSGDAVFITNKVRRDDGINTKGDIEQESEEEGVNAEEVEETTMTEEYPEKYRKRARRKRPATAPLRIGVLRSVSGSRGGPAGAALEVTLLLRPEDIGQGPEVARAPYRLVYWTDRRATVRAADLRGRCHLRHFPPAAPKNEVERWCGAGPHRFYFQQAYSSSLGRAVEVPTACREMCGDSAPSFPSVARKLACMDIFAGCGGLSAGLEQAGVAECRWALEVDGAAAKSFQKNHPQVTVFREDCREVLRLARKGVARDGSLQRRAEYS